MIWWASQNVSGSRQVAGHAVSFKCRWAEPGSPSVTTTALALVWRLDVIAAEYDRIGQAALLASAATQLSSANSLAGSTITILASQTIGWLILRTMR
jgi:hypothetical protein